MTAAGTAVVAGSLVGAPAASAAAPAAPSSGSVTWINQSLEVLRAQGIPSRGVLQVIDPTFKAYHVPGTSWSVYDPVAIITAACSYAAHRYGSIDIVNSAC